jgi:hypothetical protein
VPVGATPKINGHNGAEQAEPWPAKDPGEVLHR